MRAMVNSIRGGPCRDWLLAAAAVTLLGVARDAAFAAESTNAQRYQLDGAALLRADRMPQKSGAFSLRATLAPKDAALAAQPPVQEGSGFALMAKLAANASVCYNDTIFRDDFDGDGG